MFFYTKVMLYLDTSVHSTASLHSMILTVSFLIQPIFEMNIKKKHDVFPVIDLLNNNLNRTEISFSREREKNSMDISINFRLETFQFLSMSFFRFLSLFFFFFSLFSLTFFSLSLIVPHHF